MFFFTLAEKTYLEQTEPISTLKTMIYRNVSFQKLTQLSLGNNVLDAKQKVAFGEIHLFLQLS
jgi:hypothetical protein